ncbi:MAG: pilus assembly protein, partial [Aquamicrobium sp.]|nr:pilus assembly protein [Aquamicrobium sp.]
MEKHRTIAGWLPKAIRKLGGVIADRRGVAAIEFAFIAPLLLMLYFVTMEVAQGIETNKKVSRVGSMVADLVTQQSREISTSDLDPIMR